MIDLGLDLMPKKKGPKCPVCGKRMGDLILVCADCWKLVPQKDRNQFRKLYVNFKNHVASWKPKGDKIIRDLITKLTAMKPTLVIYHRADFDGKFCRAIAHEFFGDKADYLGWDYGDQVPVAAEEVKEIYMLDISIDGMMTDPRLIWIDHHKSAMERYSASIPGYRIDGVAACRLAWQWFFTYNNSRNPIADHFATLPDKQAFVDRKVLEPMSVRLAGEYDIWDRRDPNAELFQHGLRSMDLTHRWKDLLSYTEKPKYEDVRAMEDIGHVIDTNTDGTVVPTIVHGILSGGRVLQFAKTQENASIICQFGFDLDFEGLKFLACNAARYNSHLFSAGIKPHHEGLLGFNWDGSKNNWRISLYGVPGKPDIDLAAIAVKYGGGGHKQACGFTSQELPFQI